jgi:hypothetical protein
MCLWQSRLPTSILGVRSAPIRLHERANASWSGGERPGRRSQAPYLGVIWQLARACAGHPILLLEVPHVSLRLQARASAVDDVAAAAAAAVRAEGFAEACWAAHSYGTFCVSRVRVLAPELVHSMVRAPVRRRPTLPYPTLPLRRRRTMRSYAVSWRSMLCAACMQILCRVRSAAAPAASARGLQPAAGRWYRTVPPGPPSCLLTVRTAPARRPPARPAFQTGCAHPACQARRTPPGPEGRVLGFTLYRRGQALIDPVCFLTCYPHLLYNFIYKVPRAWDVLTGGLEGVMGAARFLFSRDLIIAEARARCPKPTLTVSLAHLHRLAQARAGSAARVQRALRPALQRAGDACAAGLHRRRCAAHAPVVPMREWSSMQPERHAS